MTHVYSLSVLWVRHPGTAWLGSVLQALSLAYEASARARVSAEADLRKDLLPSSDGCWQDSVPPGDVRWRPQLLSPTA